MRDVKKNMQVTVLNDRTQGGTADLQKSTIELMQHRRLTTFDGFGVRRWLNETDNQDIGIGVRATYYM